jgi:hypothetical protein
VPGSYDDCSYDIFLGTPGGGGLSGFGGYFTLTRSGSTVTVSYSGGAPDAGAGLDASLQFTQTSGSSATLLSGQQLAGVQVSCAPSDFAPTTVDLSSGSFTYDTGTLFLSVVGTAEPVNTTGPCSNPGGPVAFTVACGNYTVTDGGVPNVDASPSLGNEFVGTYGCDSDLVQQGGNLEAVTAGAGTLMITQSGNLLTTVYAGDTAVQGSLGFMATTSNVAVPATANESVQVECTTIDVGSNYQSAMPIASSTLTLDGTSLLLSFTGAGCGGAELGVSLLCTPLVDGGAATDAGPSDSGADH